jgi:hypothetical protein
MGAGVWLAPMMDIMIDVGVDVVSEKWRSEEDGTK